MVSTHLKNISQNGHLPQIGVKKKNIWNHHLNKDGKDLKMLWRGRIEWVEVFKKWVCAVSKQWGKQSCRAHAMQIESWKEFIRGDLKMYPKYVFRNIWKTFFKHGFIFTTATTYIPGPNHKCNPWSLTAIVCPWKQAKWLDPSGFLQGRR